MFLTSKKLLTGLCVILLLLGSQPIPSNAANLVVVTVLPSSTIAGTSNTNYIIDFTTTTTSPVQRIKIRFSTQLDGNTKPTSTNLSLATLTSTTNLGSGWSLDTGNAAAGFVTLIRDSADQIDTATEASITLSSITNSQINDCESTAKKLSDTCFIKVASYTDDSENVEVDSGSTTYTVNEDPYLHFEIKGVPNNQTHNGIITTESSTPTGLPFGHILSSEVNYIAQELVVQTNAPNGYTVYAYLQSNIRGINPANTIHPFGATNVTWNDPQPWSQPTGDGSNDNTGWFGANTTDVRLNGTWTNGTDMFGPISVAPHPVAFSDVSDRDGSSIFVTYALAINSLQPSDTYTSNLIYDVIASY